MIRNIFFVLAQSVSLNFPSSAGNFNCTILPYGSNPSDESLGFRSDQYLLGMVLASKAFTTSITEKYHSLLCQILLIFLSWKTTKALLSTILFISPFPISIKRYY